MGNAIAFSLYALLVFASTAAAVGAATAGNLRAPLSAGTVLPPRALWPDYLIEFRGINQEFRVDELADSLSFVLGGGVSSDDTLVTDILSCMRMVIPDKEVPSVPLCCKLQLPNDDIVQQVIERCCLVRSAIEVWGEGKTSLESSKDAQDRFFSPQSNISSMTATGSRSENSWRVHFRRYGRGQGLNVAGKQRLLELYKPILKSLNGDVNLTDAKHHLVNLEDWHSFHDWHDETTNGGSHHDKENDYVPLRTIFGRIVAEGNNVQTNFDIKARPFIGTTTMNPVSAHVAAVASRVGPGDRVLDPFVGTGSLLIAATALGAHVVGSDVDADCLGLLEGGSDLPAKDRSKNNRFKRHGERLGEDQLDRSTRDNFNYYGVSSQLEALLACDVREWIPSSTPNEDDVMQNYGLFDAIISDPPFGRREKAKGGGREDEEEEGTEGEETAEAFRIRGMGDPDSTLVALLSLSRARIKKGGRLVFFLPTDAFVSEEEVREKLSLLLQKANSVESLNLERVCAERLHDKLWRWLIVFCRA